MSGIDRRPKSGQPPPNLPDKTSTHLNLTKFGRLILIKIIKTVVSRSHILKTRCAKFDFGWGSAPDPAGGAHSTPQTP